MAQHQITVSLDVVGGEYLEIIFKALSLGGRYVAAGAIASPIVELDLRNLIYKNTEMIVATRIESQVFQNLLEYMEKSLLKPQVAKVFPLSQTLLKQCI